MSDSSLTCHIGGCTLIGPGFTSTADSWAVLRGEQPYTAGEAYAPPAPFSLSPNERRRAGMTVKLAVAAAEQALEAAGQAPPLPSVFGTSNGDGAVVHAMLQAVAGENSFLSPTQFHNSVHNAAAAYWSISSTCRANSTSIGAYDDTFASAMLRGALEVAGTLQPLLVCVYDAPLPYPLAEVRATTMPLAAAAVLTPVPVATSQAKLTLRFAPGPAAMPEIAADPVLTDVILSNPAARALPLFAAVARRQDGRICLPYLEDAHLTIEVACA
jgi:hypothetical protein